jgi:NTP pyrophosphatase (non-canonical NTP hydrolase)
MSDSQAACAHPRVKYVRIKEDGKCRDTWRCELDCGAYFWPMPRNPLIQPELTPSATEVLEELRALLESSINSFVNGGSYVLTYSDVLERIEAALAAQAVRPAPEDDDPPPQCAFCNGFSPKHIPGCPGAAGVCVVAAPPAQGAPMPHCWHKEIDRETGICKDCGAKAAIKLEGMSELPAKGRSSVGMHADGHSQGQVTQENVICSVCFHEPHEAGKCSVKFIDLDEQDRTCPCSVRSLAAQGAPGTREAALTFTEFSRANRLRCESKEGFDHALNSWSTSDWFTALFGELGEAANVAKKLNRIRDSVGVKANRGVGKAELLTKLRQELGDGFVYLDLLAQSLGVAISDAAVEVFNAKSDELGCPIKLAQPGAPTKEGL